MSFTTSKTDKCTAKNKKFFYNFPCCYINMATKVSLEVSVFVVPYLDVSGRFLVELTFFSKGGGIFFNCRHTLLDAQSSKVYQIFKSIHYTVISWKSTIFLMTKGKPTDTGGPLSISLCTSISKLHLISCVSCQTLHF